MFAVDKIVHHARLQRPRAKQRHQRDHLFQAVWLQTLDQILHTTGFQLENRRGLRFFQHLKSRLVIQGDAIDVQRRFTLLGAADIDHFHRPVDDGQCAQTEKVKLHQTRVFDIIFVILGNQATAAFIAKQG